MTLGHIQNASYFSRISVPNVYCQMFITTKTEAMGVTISSDLSWSRHADNVVKKADFTMGFLKRNIRSAPQAAKATAYKTFSAL